MKLRSPLLMLICAILATFSAFAAPEKLKVHGIFLSHMVIQRDKPITIWGWAPVGTEVEVSFGESTGISKAAGEKGRWEVSFDPQAANAEPQILLRKWRM